MQLNLYKGPFDFAYFYSPLDKMLIYRRIKCTPDIKVLLNIHINYVQNPGCETH